MSPTQTVDHPSLRSPQSMEASIDDAKLTDRQQLSVTLQAAGLLAHLRQAGWKLVGELEHGVVEDGTLLGLSAQPGTDTVSAHQRLRLLLLRLFRCESEIVGRGEARRSARILAKAWSQPLAVLSSDEILRQIFHNAAFLWQPECKAAHLALFASVDGAGTMRPVGPASFCLRVERLLDSGESVDDLAGSDRLRDCWHGGVDTDPMQLAESLRWVEAASSFRVNGARGEEERVAYADALRATGKFAQALDVLEGVRGSRADLIRVECLALLQRMEAARRLLIRIARGRLTTEQMVQFGNVAVRVFGIRGDDDRLEDWIGRLRRVRAGEQVLRARVTLAVAACDAGAPDEAASWLQECIALREDPVEGWRWYYADGLRALQAGDGPGAVEAFGAALLGFRRRLTRVRAALMWTNLVAAAEACGDLAAEERAARKAWALGMSFEGPLPNTVFLYNLAESLLKRGKVDGVRELIEEVAETDRRAGNHRGLAHDAELSARYHLTRGRADRALRVVDERLAEYDSGEAWRRAELLAWSARALGLLGRAEEAADRMRKGGSAGLSEFDREEIPAIWALAGLPEQALEACEGPASDFWSGAVSGEPPTRDRWRQVDLLDPYPGARLVRDLEAVRPGCVPRPQRLRAIRVLRELGLEQVAQDLERATGGAWAAVAAYLNLETGGDLRTLFADSGYGDVRLEWDGPNAEVLVDGRGGACRHEFNLDAGRLILDCEVIDQPLRVLVQLAASAVEQRSGRAPSMSSAPGGIIGESPALRSALGDVQLLARSDLPILILGETGTGKELAARWAHQQSSRARGPFLAVNCAAISDSLRNSELFGHAKGAFTGTEGDREGYFEAANGGTIFLDEIGDLSLDAQAGILRVLQESEVTRVGENRPRKVDTRVIAATHRDLRRMLHDGAFREDLYYRLSHSVVELPPLRDRGDDVLMLARHFLAKVGPGSLAVALERETSRHIRRLPWPGNVRQLKGALEAAALYSEGGPIAIEHLRLDDQPVHGAPGDLNRAVDDLRRRSIIEALDKTGGNQAEAARLMGMTRQGLSYWIRKLGIRL